MSARASAPALSRACSTLEVDTAAIVRPRTTAEFALRFEQEHIDMSLKPEYILPKLGDRRLDDITTADIDELAAILNF